MIARALQATPRLAPPRVSRYRTPTPSKRNGGPGSRPIPRSAVAEVQYGGDGVALVADYERGFEGPAAEGYGEIIGAARIGRSVACEAAVDGTASESTRRSEARRSIGTTPLVRTLHWTAADGGRSHVMQRKRLLALANSVVPMTAARRADRCSSGRRITTSNGNT